MQENPQNIGAINQLSMSTAQLVATEIVASYSGKISTGRYENEAPFFSIKESWTNIDDNFIEERQIALHSLCHNRFEECEKKSMSDRVTEQYKHVRFYSFGGEQFPSVTSIINYDKDYYIPQEQLVQYGARGTILHKQIELYHQTGEWHTPESIEELHPYVVILEKGSLGLTLDGFNFLGSMEKYPYEVISTETKVYNPEHRYAGRMDALIIYNGKRSIADYKTGQIDEDTCFEQLSAYAKCHEDIEQLVVFPINNKTQQGFSKPKITEDIDDYFDKFKKKRELFKQRFGL